MSTARRVLTALDPATPETARAIAERLGLRMPQARGALGHLKRCGMVQAEPDEQQHCRRYRSRQQCLPGGES